jgi:glycosyltransferase involved in cell wall biosynthesis
VLRYGDVQLIRRSCLAAPTWVLGEAEDDPNRGKCGTWLELRRVVRRFAPDIVHARSTGVWPDAVLATRGLKDVRLLLAFHGRTGLEPIGWRRRLINRFTTACADAVLSISHHAAREMIEQWNAEPSRMHVIPDGVNTRTFYPDSDGACRMRVRGILGLANDARVVICVANLLPVKALDMLLQTWRRVLKTDKSAQLLIVGDGPLKADLVALAHQLKCASNVRFLGRREDVPDLLRASDLFVLSSQYEGTSNAVQEAMATGLAVVATDVGGMRDLITSGRTGWLVPRSATDLLADQIQYAFANPTKRWQVGEAARQAVMQRFSMERWIEQYTALYRHMLDCPVEPSEGLACAG